MQQSVYDVFMRCLERSLKEAEDAWNSLHPIDKAGTNKMDFMRVTHKMILERCLKEQDIHIS